MPSTRSRGYESMLFNYETTERTDYRDGRIRPTVTTLYKRKPPSLMKVHHSPLKDVHAMTDWFKPIVPFDLMHKPKEIVQTNPITPQEPYSEPEDEFRAQAQATRPRLVMTPAVSVDDNEPKAREILIKDMYTTNLMHMHKQSGIVVGAGLRSPLPVWPAPADPVVLRKLKPPYVAPEWRMDSAAWDNRQLRN